MYNYVSIYIYTNIYIHRISAFHSIFVFLPFNCRTSQAWTETKSGNGDTYPSEQSAIQQSGMGEEPMQRTSPTKAVEQNIPRFGSCQNTGSSKQWIKWRWIFCSLDSYKWILRRFAQKKKQWQGLGRPQYQKISKNWSFNLKTIGNLTPWNEGCLAMPAAYKFKETFSVE